MKKKWRGIVTPMVLLGLGLALPVSCANRLVRQESGHLKQSEPELAPINEEQAVFLAEREAARRGRSNYKAFGSLQLRPNGRWHVLLQRNPAAFGAHAFVEISPDGKTIEWFPGM
jgi:hypothetical protein